MQSTAVGQRAAALKPSVPRSAIAQAGDVLLPRLKRYP